MFVRNKQQLVVDCYPPGRVRLLWMVIFALLAGLAWAIWGYAPGEVQRQLASKQQQQLQMMARLSEAESARNRLKTDVDRLNTMQEVDERAYNLLQQNFTTLQDELVELREQLAFYQAVIAPDEGKQGLKIQRFSVAAEANGRYAFSLVLLQARKTQTMVKGSLVFEVQGQLDGRRKTLSMAAVTRPPVKQVKVRFRYFQNINGSLQFPSGFVPERVKLKLDVNYPHKDVKKSYSWSRLQEQ